jgi:hypothetical protein
MDTVSAALLLAVVGGLGGAVGDQAWRGLVALVHRPVHGTSAHHSGGAQLVQLREQPDDAACAAELSRVLTARAVGDEAFRTALDSWRHGAEQLYPTHLVGTINNTVSGGTFHGPVIQTGGSVHLSGRTPPSSKNPGAA